MGRSGDSSSDKTFIGGVSVTFATEVTLSALALISGLLVARLLGPAGKGGFALVTTSIWILANTAQLGVPHAVVYYTPRIGQAALIGSALLLSACVSVGTVLLGMIVAPFVRARILSAFDPSAFLVALAAVPFLFAGNVFAALLQGRYRLREYNIVRAVPSFAFIGLFLLAIRIGHDLFIGALISWVVSQGLFAVVGFGLVARSVPWSRLTRGRPFSYGSQLIAFGLKTHMGNMLKFLQYRLDVLIVGFFLSPAQVGYYVVAMSISELVWKLPNAVGAVLLPKVAGVTKKEYTSAFTSTVSRHVTLVTVLSLALLLGTARPLIDILYGMAFRPAYEPLLILMPGALCLSVWKVLASDLIAQGYPGLYGLSALVSVLTMVTLDLLLIPSLGVSGAAAASSVAYIVAAALLLAMYSRITGTPFLQCVLPSKEDFDLYRRIWSALSSQVRQWLAGTQQA